MSILQEAQGYKLIGFPQYPEDVLFVSLVDNLENAAEIKENVLKGNADYDYCFLATESLLSVTHLLAGLYRGILDCRNNQMKARTVHAQLVFSFSPNQNIMESLKRFGISDSSKSIIAVRVLKSESAESLGKSCFENLQKIAKGTFVDLANEAIKSHSNITTIRKNYKLQSLADKDESALEDAVVGLISLRGY